MVKEQHYDDPCPDCGRCLLCDNQCKCWVAIKPANDEVS